MNITWGLGRGITFGGGNRSNYEDDDDHVGEGLDDNIRNLDRPYDTDQVDLLGGMTIDDTFDEQSSKTNCSAYAMSYVAEIYGYSVDPSVYEEVTKDENNIGDNNYYDILGPNGMHILNTITNHFNTTPFRSSMNIRDVICNGNPILTDILGITSYSCGLDQAYIIETRNKKNSISFTPLIDALNPFSFALKDSAEALVLLLSKKFSMFW